jgi:two-component system, sensor histidine kinase
MHRLAVLAMSTSTPTLYDTPPDSAAVEQQIRIAQAAMVFERSRKTTMLGIPVAALLCWLMWSYTPMGLLLFWFAGKCLTSSARLWVTMRFKRDDPAKGPYWVRRFEWTLFADGAMFGLLGSVMQPPNDPVMGATLLTTVVAIAGLALVVMAMSFRTLVAMALPLLVPGICYHLFLGTPVGWFTALGLSVFLFIVISEGKRSAEHTRSMLRLRFQMDELARQRQQALDLAHRNSAVKDRFLATMSHELRTPLHGMLGLARLIEADHQPVANTEQVSHLQMLQRTCEHLLGVINDVLDYSKIDGGHMQLAQRQFDLRALLESVMAVSTAQAEEKGLRLNLMCNPTGEHWVVGDPTRLRQILINLVGNAVKFTEQGGVSLRSHHQADGSTVIEVQDSGEGIPADQLEAVFSPFHQVDDTDRRRHGGTGLGLTISREIARAMKGELVCQSQPGHGTTFKLTLNLPSSAPLVQFDTHINPSVPLDDLKVLLVEDNLVNALVAGAILKALGIQHDQAEDGSQAVTRYAAARYDLILMDCQMPGMDGFEATRQIRALEQITGQAHVPIVALTANALEGDRERALDAGMDDYLAKPFTDGDLAKVIRRNVQR